MFLSKVFSKCPFVGCGCSKTIKIPNIFTSSYLINKYSIDKQIINYSVKSNKNSNIENRIIELENAIEILKNKNKSFTERIDNKSLIKDSIKSVNEYVHSIKFDLNYPLFKNEFFYFITIPGQIIIGGVLFPVFNALGACLMVTGVIYTPVYVARTLYRTFSKLDYDNYCNHDATCISNIYKIRFNNMLCDNKIHLKDVKVKDYLTEENCKVAIELDSSNLEYVPNKYKP